MDEDAATQTAPVTERRQSDEPAVTGEPTESPQELKSSPKKKKKSKCTKAEHKTKSKKVRAHRSKTAKHRSSSEDSVDSSDSLDSSDSDSDTSSDDEKLKKKIKAKKAKTAARKAKAKKSRKHRKIAFDSDSESSASEDPSSDSSSDEEPARRKKASKKKKVQASDSDAEESSDAGDATLTDLQSQLEALKLQIAAGRPSTKARNRRLSISTEKTPKLKRRSSSKKGKDDGLQFKRVDHLWDSSIHNWKIKESAADDDSEFAEYAFLIRRCFDWENKYSRTEVDIKSKPLRAVLAEVRKL
jgi:hypothetical protein